LHYGCIMDAPLLRVKSEAKEAIRTDRLPLRVPEAPNACRPDK